uniref:J domain-containing protein n=1 Tax=Oryza glumipatula TaxID=40148 RepID=A0A0D9Y6N1_9ORYZ
MDPAADPLSASAPFPTIPAASSPRHPRAARPRRQPAPFRSSDHPGAASASASASSSSSSSSTRRLGVDLPVRHGVRRGAGAAGSRAPSGFVFGGGDTAAPGLVDVEGCSPTSASSWSSSSFVFGASDTRSSFSFGSSKAAPSSSFSATVGELTIDDPRNRQGDADVSGGNGSLPEMITDSVLSPNIVRQEIDHRDEGLGAPSQTMGRESTESSCSLVGQVDRPSLCTAENVATQFAKDEGKISADGADSRESKSVFVFGENSEERGFTTKITETEIKKGDSVEKKIVAFGSDQLDASVAEGNACTESSFQGERHGCGSSMRDHRGVSTRAKASNALPFGLVVQDSGAKVSSTKLSDERRSAGVPTSELGDLGLVDEQSFTVRDNDAASREYGGVKGVSMNKRAVQQEKFSAHQVPLPLFISDQKAAPEVNLHLKEVTNFRLEDSDISKGNSGTKEEDVNCFSPQATESNHDRTVFTSVTNLENSSHSDFIFAASTDHSKLHSQRRPSKKKIGGMSNHANSVESRPSSAIGLAHSEISRQQYTDLPAQWTKYNKADPKTVTVSVGPAIKENIGHQEDCETWRIRGNQAYAEGQLAKAEECYTHGINSVSLNEASWKSLMLCYSNRAATRMSLGRMREALSDCRKATDIDSSFLKAQIRAANCLLALGDVEEAQKGFEICLKSNHEASLDSKITEEASDGIKKAKKVSNFMLLSKEYIVKKEFDKIPSALQMISDALSTSTYSDNLMMMKAEALLLLQRYEEVIRFCEETLHLAEENSFSPCQHSKIIDLDNCSSSVKLWRYYIIAKSYFFTGKLEEAHQFLKKLGQEALAAGNEAFQAGKYSEAVEHYTAALLSNTESPRFSAICFANRAAAYQAMGQILDAIADCSLAIALDSNYFKAISRRAGLYELIRDYDQAGNDLRRLISLLERQLQENIYMPSEKSDGIRSSLNRSNLRLSALERDAKKGISLNVYLILGIEPSCTFLDIKKAYRKAALRHHPDKAGNFLVRSENINDAVWRDIANDIRKDADYLFKLIGKAYAILSDPTTN